MADLQALLLESWDRQSRIIASLAGLVTEENRHFKATADGWDLAGQLAHIHGVRTGWLQAAAPEIGQTLSFLPKDAPLEPIREALAGSAAAVRQAVAVHSAREERFTPYDHPLFFLQHMVWHEGWHAGLIVTAFRVNGHELPEVWEELNLWAAWRDAEV